MSKPARMPERGEVEHRSKPLALKQQTMEAVLQPLAYRIDQAASVIGFGRTKVYQLIREGKLRAHRHDGLTLIHRADLEAYLAASAVPLPAKIAQ